MADRPWGLTLAGLWLRNVTAQLTVEVLRAPAEPGFAIALQDGAVVGATSPRTADTAVRIAANAGFVRTAQLAELTARIAALPERDDVDVLAEHARLRPEIAQRLRRLVITQRAARTFELERGEAALDARISIPVGASCAVAMPAVVHCGARQVLDEAQVVAQLGRLGTRFTLKPNPTVELGPVPGSKIALELLARGCDVTELAALPATLDRHGVFAVVYTLACCGACEIAPHAPSPRERTGPVPRERTGPVPRERTGPVPLVIARREASGALPAIADGTPRRPTPASGTGTRAVIPPREPSAQSSKPSRIDTGGIPAPRRDPRSEPTLSRTATGSAAFRRGQQALADGNYASAIDELATTIKLDPTRADAHAMIAWARFCSAADQRASAAPTRRALKAALAMATEPVVPTLYLARLARALDRDPEARGLLQRVLELDPDHAEARGELEQVEYRLAHRGGLFGWLRRATGRRPDDKR